VSGREFYMTAEAIGVLLHWAAGLLNDGQFVNTLVAIEWSRVDAEELLNVAREEAGRL
jgi:hypothetical protein